MVVLLAVAGWGFRYIPQQFMPLLNKQYFSVDMWLPEGTRIEESEKQAAQLTEYLQTFDGVKKVSTYIHLSTMNYYQGKICGKRVNLSSYIAIFGIKIWENL